MRIAVVGGGIVGLATAFRLQQRLPDARVTILEKSPRVGSIRAATTAACCTAAFTTSPDRAARAWRAGSARWSNSARTRYPARSVAAKWCRRPVRRSAASCTRCSSAGCQNGLAGLRLLSREELREIEPHAGGVEALHVPQEGIADYPAVCETLAGLVRKQGGEIVTGACVTSLHREAGGWRAGHTAGETACDFLVTCAGLHSDRVAELAGRKREVHILFRGEYYLIRPERQFLVRNLIYPVADPASFPGRPLHAQSFGRHRSRSERGAGVRARRLHHSDVNLADSG